MASTLPFKRGTTQSAPGLEGLRLYDDEFKQTLVIYKNTSAAALAAYRTVKDEDPEKYEVQQSTTAGDGPTIRGVVDPELGSSTVPVNRHFYVVERGICTAVRGTGAIAIATGSLLYPAGGADSAGKLQALTAAVAASAALGALEAADLANFQHVCAVSQAAHAVTTVSSNIQVRLDIRGA
jgi:hypothetical protein